MLFFYCLVRAHHATLRLKNVANSVPGLLPIIGTGLVDRKCFIPVSLFDPHPQTSCLSISPSTAPSPKPRDGTEARLAILAQSHAITTRTLINRFTSNHCRLCAPFKLHTTVANRGVSGVPTAPRICRPVRAQSRRHGRRLGRVGTSDRRLARWRESVHLTAPIPMS